MNSRTAGRWTIQTVTASPAVAHGLEVPSEPPPLVWVIAPRGSAVVLGSTQSLELVEPDQAKARSLAVVKRRSGGGAVLVVPGDLVWIDVIVPRGDVLWSDDVGVAAERLGAVWLEALAPWLSDAWVHRGAMVNSDLARLVCFAGIGPGEVLVPGRGGGPGAKVVGISQRRTRAFARFQCACVLSWDPAPLLDVLKPLRALDSLSSWHQQVSACGAGVGDGATADSVVEAFVAALAGPRPSP